MYTADVSARAVSADPQAERPPPRVHSDGERAMWRTLFETQTAALRGKAYPGFFENVETLGLTASRIPTLDEVSDIIEPRTGWRMQPVRGLVSEEAFYGLLARRRFPSTTYVRDPEFFELSLEPDMFHEVFGHAPTLLDAAHADNIQRLGELGTMFDEIERRMLTRLFWYIYESGQLQTTEGVRILGGGSLSCHGETVLLYSGQTDVVPLDLMDALRSPYPFDRLFERYYVVQGAAHIAEILADAEALRSILRRAYEAGEFTPYFPVDGINARGVGYCAFTLPGPVPA